MRRDAVIDLAGFVRASLALQRRLERLASRLSDAYDDVDAAAKAVADLVERLGGAPGLDLRGLVPRSPEERRIMRAEARAGASSLHVARSPDGSGEVSISGRPAFRLSPKLAALIEILATRGELADDGLPAWRTTSEVAAALSKATGRPVRARDVPRIVYNLRRAFRDAGENWFIVCTNPRLGVRLALR
jgi:hypothetical protein